MAEVRKLDQSNPKEEKPEATASAAVPPTLEPAPLKGILGTKIGMMRVFVDDTHMVPVTVISAEGVMISQVKTIATDGYNAVQVGFGDVLERKLSKAEVRHFGKNGLAPKRQLREFRVADPSLFKVGQPVPVSVLAKGDWVSVSGISKGKGFAGVVKRYGFKGGPHSHGHGEYRNSPGSSGAQGPQHVLPGTRKPGHKGSVQSSMPRIQVVDVDVEQNLVLLKGSVPGPRGNLVVISPTKKTVVTS